MTWTLLAGIGWVESQHGMTAPATLGPDGVVSPPTFGPQTSPVDTDLGHLDGTDSYDRAAGPFQLNPPRWAEFAIDADGDGERNPQDIYDSSTVAATILCQTGQELDKRSGLRWALRHLNENGSYGVAVRKAASYYRLHPRIEAQVIEEALPSFNVQLDQPTPSASDANRRKDMTLTPSPAPDGPAESSAPSEKALPKPSEPTSGSPTSWHPTPGSSPRP